MGRRTRLASGEIATYCTNCDDFTTASKEGDSARCTDCGAFASTNPAVCCARHEVRRSPYPSGQCPRCEQEQSRRAQRMHEMTRDPRVEPY